MTDHGRPTSVQCTECKKWIPLDLDLVDQTLTYWGQSLRTNDAGEQERLYYGLCKPCGDDKKEDSVRHVVGGLELELDGP